MKSVSLCPFPRQIASVLTVRNRQRSRRIDLSLLRCLTRTVLQESLRKEQFELGLYLVGTEEMTKLNETFLRHRGSTDVITFDYGASEPGYLMGEIFVCVDEALLQAKRFRTTWQSELVRYIIHGLLHLCGYNDRQPAPRRRMKRVEGRLLRELSALFAIKKVARRAH